MNYRAVLAIMLVVFAPCCAVGQTLLAEKNDKASVSAETKKGIAELEKRAEGLRAENAVLRKRVVSLMLILGGHADPSDSAKQLAGLSVEASLLDAENQALKNKLEALKKTFVGDGNNDAGAGKQAPPDSKGLASESILSILKTMPKDLLPAPEKGWDKWGYPKAKAWIKDAFSGEQFEAEVLLQYAKVGEYDPDRKAWRVTVAFNFPKTAFTFHRNRVEINPWNRYTSSKGKLHYMISPVGMFVSEDTAKRLQKLRKGATLKWRGEMSACELQEARHAGKVGYIINTYISTLGLTILEEKPTAPKPRGLKVTPKVPANRAASRLKLAKGYISAGLNQKAKAVLEEIVSDYPKSKEATQAKSLLESIEALNRK